MVDVDLHAVEHGEPEVVEGGFLGDAEVSALGEGAAAAAGEEDGEVVVVVAAAVVGQPLFRRAVITDSDSGASVTFPLRRLPAVSTIRYARPPTVRRQSTESRVVPGTSLTSERSSPISALSSEDLPTLGRPAIASRISDDFPRGDGVDGSFSLAGAAGSNAVIPS